MGGDKIVVEKFDPEKTVDLIWTRDSETSEYVLVDSVTNKEVYRGREKF